MMDRAIQPKISTSYSRRCAAAIAAPIGLIASIIFVTALKPPSVKSIPGKKLSEL